MSGSAKDGLNQRNVNVTRVRNITWVASSLGTCVSGCDKGWVFNKVQLKGQEGTE